MTKDTLIFIEKLSSNLITFVKVYVDDDPDIQHFRLPSDLALENPLTASLEPFVQIHSNENKQAVRDKIASEIYSVRAPGDNMMTMADDNLAIITDEGLFYFKPEEVA